MPNNIISNGPIITIALHAKVVLAYGEISV